MNLSDLVIVQDGNNYEQLIKVSKVLCRFTKSSMMLNKPLGHELLIYISFFSTKILIKFCM